MSNSPSIENQTRFIGMNLRTLGSDLLLAWRGMATWRIFSWLWPASTVRLFLPTGVQALGTDFSDAPVNDVRRTRSARFEAIVVPENLLLRRTINLPKLQPAELTAALSLEVQTASPFPVGDTVWAHQATIKSGGTSPVDLVLSSRKLIGQYFGATYPQLKPSATEVWVPRVKGSGFLMLPGFGERQRQRRDTLWRWASALLALLALVLVVAIVATPSIKLYIKVLQANQAMEIMQKKIAPALAQRESLVRSTEQLADLALLTGKSLPPLQMLNIITEALPDDTSLLGLQIQGLKVTLSGQTVNTSTLMKQLGATPGLRDVQAPTPATKPLGTTRESFSIEFTIDPAQLKPSV